MKNELLPCPFCGKPARLDMEGDHHGGFFSLGCCADRCPGRYVYYTESIDCLDTAIARWNTRHVSPSCAHRNGETDTPTEPGKYWFSGNFAGHLMADVISVYSGGSVWYADAYDKIDNYDGQWWGPLTPPWEANT